MEANKSLIPQQDEVLEAEIVNDNTEGKTILYNIFNSPEIKKLRYEIAQKWIADAIILEEQYREYCRNKNNLQYIVSCHNMLIDTALSCNMQFWRSGDTTYYRVGRYGKKQKLDKDQMLATLGIDIEILKNTEQWTPVFNKDIIVCSYLLDVKKEIFYPYSSDEWIQIDNFWYRNIFKITEHIVKKFQYCAYLNSAQQIPYRYQTPNFYNYHSYQAPIVYEQPITLSCSTINKPVIPVNIPQVGNNFVVDFLESMFKNTNDFLLISYWLKDYFLNFKSSRYVIVLVGDNRTTGYFIDHIIKPIFIQDEQYFRKVDDDFLSKNTVEIVQKNKLFYHFEYSNEKNSATRDNKISEAIINILERQNNNDIENFTNAEIIVTADKDNPYGALKDCYTRCLVFSVRNLDAILNRLNIERSFLADFIKNELGNFTDILCTKRIEFNPYDSQEKELLPYIKNGIFITSEIDIAIGNFLTAIKNNDKRNFSKLKEKEPRLYTELESDLNEKKIAQPLLGKYFDYFYDDIIFGNENSYFLEVLKERDSIFKQKVTDESKKGSINNNKRYDLTYIHQE
ncbi:hypothetical protein [Campylobacter mucosalis]|uniref:hypothetical protein n=1 Tax=Campylobacter mucosalis TaxID=202 RepID=UPI00147021A3|nr:hypothetical protein [Campylobacter mucosalis]